jgi:hypothetical protein
MQKRVEYESVLGGIGCPVGFGKTGQDWNNRRTVSERRDDGPSEIR